MPLICELLHNILKDNGNVYFYNPVYKPMHLAYLKTPSVSWELALIFVLVIGHLESKMHHSSWGRNYYTASQVWNAGLCRNTQSSFFSLGSFVGCFSVFVEDWAGCCELKHEWCLPFWKNHNWGEKLYINK